MPKFKGPKDPIKEERSRAMNKFNEVEILNIVYVKPIRTIRGTLKSDGRLGTINIVYNLSNNKLKEDDR